MSEKKEYTKAETFTGFLLFCALIVGGFYMLSSDEPSAADIRLDHVMEVVQKARSRSDKPILEHVTNIVATRQAEGHVYKIGGWQVTRELSNKWGGTIYNVYLSMHEDGQELKFHWIVHEETGTLHPVSEYARKVSDKQNLAL